jgi:hypothetical protein
MFHDVSGSAVNDHGRGKSRSRRSQYGNGPMQFLQYFVKMPLAQLCKTKIDRRSLGCSNSKQRLCIFDLWTHFTSEEPRASVTLLFVMHRESPMEYTVRGHVRTKFSMRCLHFLYGRAGRLAAIFGGFRVSTRAVAAMHIAWDSYGHADGARRWRVTWCSGRAWTRSCSYRGATRRRR